MDLLERNKHADNYHQILDDPEYRPTQIPAQRRTGTGGSSNKPEPDRPSRSSGALQTFEKSIGIGHDKAEDPFAGARRPVLERNYLTRHHVLKCWSNRSDENEDFGSIVRVRSSRLAKDASESHNGLTTWVHYQEPEAQLSRAQLEVLFKEQAHASFVSDMSSLVSSLLARAQRHSDKTFVGGHFWQPGVMRYDALQSSTGSSADPSTFLNFPYFCLEPHRSVKRQRHDESTPLNRGYLVRSLLQSFYRLELTDRRDARQCVTGLSIEQLNRCLWPVSGKHSVRKPATYTRKEVLTVQQAWCLSTIEDVLMTYSPLDVQQMVGVVIPKYSTEEDEQMVVFTIRVAEKTRRYQYRADTCDSWFGLLHRHNHILTALNMFTEKGQQKESWKLYTQDNDASQHEITMDNWVSILKAHRGAAIEVHIKQTMAIPIINAPHSEASTGEQPAPPSSSGTSLTFQNGSGGISSDIAAGSGSGSTRDTSTSGQSKSPALIGVRQVLQVPFLHWRARESHSLDFEEHGREFGNLSEEQKKNKSEEQESRNVKDWLDSTHSERKPILQRYGQLVVGGSKSISESYTASFEDLCKLAPDEELRVKPAASELNPVASDLLEVTQHIFEAFLPGVLGCLKGMFVDRRATTACVTSQEGTSGASDKGTSGSLDLPRNVAILDGVTASSTPDCDHQLAKLFRHVLWSILQSLMGIQAPEGPLESVLKSMISIRDEVLLIHLGVYSLQGERSLQAGKVYSGSALFQRHLLDAFEHLLYIYFALRQWLLDGLVDASDLPRFIADQANYITTILTKTRNRIIVEGGHEDKTTTLGPMVTSEAMLIMILDRLARGVCGNGTIDVLDVYEYGVEKLKLKIAFSASRRLLQQMNNVSEELDAVKQVLVQQLKVLSLFKDSLDPSSFGKGKADVERLTRFVYERDVLDSLLRRQADRLAECDELRARMRALSVQNVQLVETQLDDNNRAILIFTIVTVVFLPMTFVSGFFGMNLKGFSGNEQGATHYWEIATPLTLGIAVPCIFLAFLRPMTRLWARVWTYLASRDAL